ncbi:MAG TPA: FHA domain-containing protein, partial [Trebonia sp.]|nr:FHA domain-containing protein [Trebonia sp.]
MNALTLTLIRVAFLAVLWLFVIAAIGVVRTDLFGTAAAKIRRGRNRPPQRQPQRPPRQPRPSRGTPRFLVVTEGGLSGMSIDLTDQQI